MSSIILTHNSSYMIMGQGAQYLTIEVILDINYTIKFTYKNMIGCYPPYFTRETYIRDIQYIPNVMLEAIKLMHIHENDETGEKIYNTLSQIFIPTLQQELIADINAQEVAKTKKVYENDINIMEKMLEDKSQEIDRLKSNLRNAQNENIILQKTIKDKIIIIKEKDSALEEYEKDVEEYENDEAKYKKEIEEYKENKKRLLKRTNDEKLKNIALTDTLNDTIDLYESLLNSQIV